MYFLHTIICLFTCLYCPYTYAQNIKVSYSIYQIDGSTKKDSAMQVFLLGYRDSISRSMNTVIGFSVNGMVKRQPESGLGNFVADAVKTIGEKIFNQHIDAAFINYGGIKSYLAKGDVTLGSIFDLIRFDNLLVLQKVRGDSLLSFLNHVADKNGWPLSGITMGINNKKAVDVLINGNALSVDSIYTVANADYIAKGGDNSPMIKVFPLINKGYLVRDAVISYVQLLTEQGKSIDAKTDKRIVYVNQ